MNKTKALIMVALACFACMPVNASPKDTSLLSAPQTSVGFVGQPDDITYDYAVQGTVVGNWAIGIGSPGPFAPLWAVSAPPGATCGMVWHFNSPNIHVWCPSECNTCINGYTVTIVGRPPTGGDWVYIASATLSEIDSGFCCTQPVPQHCNGTWNTGQLVTPGSCVLPTPTPRPTATPRPTPTPR